MSHHQFRLPAALFKLALLAVTFAAPASAVCGTVKNENLQSADDVTELNLLNNWINNTQLIASGRRDRGSSEPNSEGSPKNSNFGSPGTAPGPSSSTPNDKNLSQVDAIRNIGRISKNKNIGFANFNIGGEEGNLIGVSGKDFNPPLKPINLNGVTYEIAHQKNQSTFTATPTDKNPRDTDSEYKILEVLASKYDQNRDITGTVYLFTERSPCDSCKAVIQQFKERFPKINVTVEDGGR